MNVHNNMLLPALLAYTRLLGLAVLAAVGLPVAALQLHLLLLSKHHQCKAVPALVFPPPHLQILCYCCFRV